MINLDNTQRISLAKILMESLNTGDWEELFAITGCESYPKGHSYFYQDVKWQNEGLKKGCIGAVNHILSKDAKNILSIWNFDGIKSALKRKDSELHNIIEAIVNGDNLKVVAKPNVVNINENVYEALEDAEVLIRERGVANGYDRMHTALHGFLRQVCENKGIPYDKTDNVNALLPKINDYINAQLDVHGRNKKVFAMLRSANSMLDNINYLRNHHSMSHPTKELLNESDAQFVINLARSIMTYVDDLIKV